MKDLNEILKAIERINKDIHGESIYDSDFGTFELSLGTNGEEIIVTMDPNIILWNTLEDCRHETVDPYWIESYEECFRRRIREFQETLQEVIQKIK